jgi:hypothetical protein
MEVDQFLRSRKSCACMCIGVYSTVVYMIVEGNIICNRIEIQISIEKARKDKTKNQSKYALIENTVFEYIYIYIYVIACLPKPTA